jgi:hypothetical protein
MFTVDSSFIGDFKRGDNLNYNIKVLTMLYKKRKDADRQDKPLFNKPITILNISIIEAALWDFYLRCKTFTREGVVNIGNEFINYVRVKKLNRLRLYIECANNHDLFEDPSKKLYNDLVGLSVLRNRIHIQNENDDLERDDSIAFSETRLKLSEQCLEKVFKVLSQKHPRHERLKGYVDDFVLPWDEHFPDFKIPVSVQKT